MGLCDSIIAHDISFSCDDFAQKGLEADGVIINRKDVDFENCDFNSSNPNIIETLALKSGKIGYEVQQVGSTPFTGTQTALEVGTYRNTFTNTVSLVVLANNPEVSNEIIDALANGEFVVVLRNKNKKNKGEYQVYGYDQGLRASEITNEKYSDDTDGGWLVNLQETGAPKSAMFLYDTDAATTKAAYDALTTAVQNP